MRALVLALLALAALAPVAAGAPPSRLGHEGRWYTDAQGRVVVLHGLNVVAKRPPYLPSAIGIDEDDAAFMQREGFNAIRLGVIYTAVEPMPGVYDDAYLGQIAQTVRTFARHGIRSLLDFHQDLFNERFQGQGFPDWAVLDDGLPAQPQAGFPANYLAMPALWRAFDNFWANAPGPGGVGLQDRYAAAWRHVVERLRAEPGVIGYDLMNEPFPGSQWPTCASPSGCAFEANELTAFSRRMLAAIRQADQAGLVHYEPSLTFDFGLPTTHQPLGDPNVAFSFHVYCLQSQFGLPDGLTTPGCVTGEQRSFDYARAQAAKDHAPELMTEFGSTAKLDVIARNEDEADRARVGWLEWTYHSNGATDNAGTPQLVKDPKQPPEGANVDAGQLGALVRPYPQAIAGTPERWAFDAATRTFELDFKPPRLDGGAFTGGVSEVFLPPRIYKDGYTVSVTGAHGASPIGAALLKLVSDGGEVRLRVTPGCRDDEGPVPTLARLRGTHGRLTIRGRAHDLGCGIEDAPVTSLRVSVARLTRDRRCRFVRAHGGLGLPQRSCAPSTFPLRARGTRAFSLRLRRLPPGRYIVAVRGRDAAGNIGVVAARPGRVS